MLSVTSKKESEEKADEPVSLEARAKRSLEQVVLCLHRAVMEEFANSYRRHVSAMLGQKPQAEDTAASPDGPKPDVVPGQSPPEVQAGAASPPPKAADPSKAAATPASTPEPESPDTGLADDADAILLHEKSDWLELAAQFETELMENPPAVRLRQFYACIGALGSGVLRAPQNPRVDTRASDQGARELVALNGICMAHQRVSGELSGRNIDASSEKSETRSETQSTWAGQDVLKPLTAILSGALVAGGAVAGLKSAWMAVLLGAFTSLGAAWAFKYSSSTTKSHERQLDLTFIPNLRAETLDRVLPTLLRRLTNAGLAPVLVIDELDKLGELSWRLEAMVRYLKKLMTENVFSCFLTDRSYLEFVSLGERKQAYGKTYSYFSHSLFVFYEPRDLDAYMTDLFDITGSVTEEIDVELLKWILRHRSEMHALGLSREIAALRMNDNDIVIQGDLRKSPLYTIDLTLQVAIEYFLSREDVNQWLALRPKMRLTLIDALYYISRCWRNGDAEIDLSSPGGETMFFDYLRGRVNLVEVSRRGQSDAQASDATFEALIESDRTTLLNIVRELAKELAALAPRFKSPPGTKTPLPPGAVVPRSEVLGAVRSEMESILEETGPWRYRFRKVIEDVTIQPFAQAGATASPDAAGVVLGEASGVTQQGEAEKAESMAERLDKIAQRARPSIDYLDRLERVLSPLVLSLDRPDTSVYQTLSDRLGLIPVSPGWSHAQQAQNRLRQAIFTNLSIEELQTDITDLEAFKANVQLCVPSICAALGLAVGLGQCRVLPGEPYPAPAPPDSDYFRGLLALSTGLKSRTRDIRSVEYTLKEFQNQLRVRFPASNVTLEWPTPLSESPALDHPFDYITKYCEDCRLGCAGLLNYSFWGEFDSRAWRNFDFEPNGEPLLEENRPTQFELICCAAAGRGPARYFERNPVSVPVEDWTSLVVRVMKSFEMGGINFNPWAEVPENLFPLALRMLNFHLLGPARIRPALMEWSALFRDEMLTEQIESLWWPSPQHLSSEDSFVKRVIVYVRSEPHSASLAWTRSPPGEALVVVTAREFDDQVAALLPLVGAGSEIRLRWEGKIQGSFRTRVGNMLAGYKGKLNVSAETISEE
ncbi:hypothetical protein [Caballeronia hypogeia]|uniref:hypothetical protein n=1 Tax=Caballeronia hypogeia TaxID=1777140 RepID=UPI0012FD16DC|nr:hypothetical protein [Caballeronia hypogeia]